MLLFNFRRSLGDIVLHINWTNKGV